MNKFALGLAVIALLISGLSWIHSNPSATEFGSANCTGGVTCFTDLAATNSLASDGTFGAAATSTLSDTVNFNNPAICINLYATSTATRLHLTASTTGTLPTGAAAVLTADYGACAN